LRRRFLTLALLGLLVSLAPAGNAGGPHRGGLTVSRSIVAVSPDAPPAIAPSFRYAIPRARVHGFRPFTRFAAPVYAAPVLLYGPPGYAEPQAAYASPADIPVLVTPPPPPPPERDVVQYSDGRHELRGDGIAIPYRWVWIPNPPPPPRPERDVRLYGWIDERGMLHVSDRLEKVPEQHREQAKRNASS